MKKNSHKSNIYARLKCGRWVRRNVFEADRKKYGLEYDRRLRELSYTFIIQKDIRRSEAGGWYIYAWKLLEVEK